MPIIKTKGAASSQGFGEFTVTTPPVVNYIEDVFSTYLYKGNGSTQTVTNGIDLAGNGGLVWIKNRTAAFGNRIYSNGLTASGYFLYTNSTNAQANSGNALTYASNGWSIVSGNNDSNDSIYNYVSWTFRKQAKFFDIVTYTGDGVSGRTLAHSLGSVPGCMIVKSTSNADDWIVYHRGLSSPTTSAVYLNSTSAVATGLPYFPTTPTATDFYLAGSGYSVNQSGQTYVAYLFAHDAGGFGLTGSDNVISCGSYTGNGSTTGPVVTLGYEPQWILIKKVSGGTSIASSSWVIFDTMRGIATISSGSNPVLYPNLADAEDGQGAAVFVNVSATGFNMVGPFDLTNASSSDYIYIAIRRGPMKVPTSGTSVFYPTTYSGNVAQSQNAGFNGDLLFIKQRTAGGDRSIFIDRLRGWSLLNAASTSAQLTPTDFGLSNSQFPSFVNSASNGVSNYAYIPVGDAGWNGGANTYVDYVIARAPGFFDEVCYTGTGVARTVAHNLTVVPELMIVKPRSNASTEWNVYAAPLGPTKYLYLQGTNAVGTGVNRWNDTSPTSSVFTVATDTSVNGSGYTLVAYLFATCAGVSKVGSYTGTAALLTVNCGFAAGARFVLIKRTDSTGDWYVYDSARGITSGNDPYLLINSTAAEVTGTNYVDTDTTGFKVTAAAPAGLNASGGTYIFLAIA